MQAGFPKKAVHGGKIIEFRCRTGDDLLDVSASMNPFVPAVSCAFDARDCAVYPDDSYARLKAVIADVFHRPVDEICVGNGSAEIIRVYAKVMLDESATYSVQEPTFAEYAVSAELTGAVRAESDADVSFICNPNNPTGELKSRAEVLALCDEARSLFVDEAFMELAARDESVVKDQKENLFVLRSLTKCFSVPGIRFGFGFGPADLVEKIETARTPWTVNAFAEKYAIAAFAHYDELKESAEKISREREWYFAGFKDVGLSCSASEVNYITIRLPCSASVFAEKMLAKGIMVRDCTSFGLPDSIRVSIETHEKNKRVFEAITECLH